MKTYVQRIHTIESCQTNDRLSDADLLDLAKYLYKEGFIKVITKWNAEKECNETHYVIEAVIEEELNIEDENNESLKENNESLEEIHKKQKSFFERLFRTFRNNN